MIKWPLVSLACREIDKYISVMHKNVELDIFNKFSSLNRKDMFKISEPVCLEKQPAELSGILSYYSAITSNKYYN